MQQALIFHKLEGEEVVPWASRRDKATTIHLDTLPVSQSFSRAVVSDSPLTTNNGCFSLSLFSLNEKEGVVCCTCWPIVKLRPRLQKHKEEKHLKRSSPKCSLLMTVLTGPRRRINVPLSSLASLAPPCISVPGKAGLDSTVIHKMCLTGYKRLPTA